MCWPNVVKLCRRDVEQRLARNIQALRPDLVAIQEVLPEWLCRKWRLALPGSVCAGDDDVPQIRRLVGPDYSIICDGRNQFECIAVHTDAGRIEGVEPGELAITGRIDRDGVEGCRRSVSIVVATVEIRGRVFDVVNAHAENRDPACRLAAIRQIFEGDQLVREPQVLLTGDYNMDPWREDDASTHYWRQQVGMAGHHAFIYHSGIAEKQPPHPTLRYPFLARTYDHVASNFLTGVCEILGESPGTERLDGGRGCDHRAVYGILSWAP
ncbi:MAG: endonuclease/exonuclease/phosphatase family protein [Anaerolineae bacterium]|nr:endonuclease/exonuclease/phosphatase family protein [Anaerolineae bacterium]